MNLFIEGKDGSTDRLMVIMAMDSNETPTLAYWTNGKTVVI